jgi:inhibitor of cysteine peptidase
MVQNQPNIPEQDNPGKKDKFIYLLYASIILTLIVMMAVSLAFSERKKSIKAGNENGPETSYSTKINYFKSCEELKEKVKDFKDNSQNGLLLRDSLGLDGAGISKPITNSNSQSQYYTGTNIQVSDIDEGDILKTNGNILVYLNRYKKEIEILKVFPLNNIEKLSNIKLPHSVDSYGNNNELLLYKDKLVFLGSSYKNVINRPGINGSLGEISPDSRNITNLLIYDIFDPASPKQLRNIEIEGSVVTSRLNKSYIYIITNNYVYNFDNPIPLLRDDKFGNSFKPSSECNEIVYSADEYIYPSFSTIATIDLNNFTAQPKITNYVGNPETVYMNQNSVYLVNLRTEYTSNRLRKFFGGFSSYEYKNYTKINKFSYYNDEITFKAGVEFEGKLLNQFSLDEYEDNLRVVATQDEHSSNSVNFLRVYDSNLNKLSEISDLARGERIYSARFNGKKAVMVTFRQVDPLFVFDLSNPKQPMLRGELKIPGYSDYLHFIDDNTVLGLGKDTIEAQQGTGSSGNTGMVWNQGIKLGLFDITDETRPKEMSKLIIGDRGTESPALRDHKAFIYDSKNKLVMFPATIYKINSSQCKEYQSTSPCFGIPFSQGTQVIKIKGNSLSHDIEISHDPYSLNSINEVKRNLVINDKIVTVSDIKLQINDSDTLILEGEIKF